MNRFNSLIFQAARVPRLHFNNATTLMVPSTLGMSRKLSTHKGIYSSKSEGWRATTILAVRKEDDICVIGDGQVSLGPTILKPNANKIRRIGEDGGVIAGYAGATADCFTLLERLETKLEQYPGQLLRASVELAKAWRTDKYLRHLEAMLVACDKDVSLIITGNGDVVEPKDGIIAIGSGGLYAAAAARALIDIDGLTSRDIATKAMTIAADTCVYTNHNFVIETLPESKDGEKSKDDVEA